MKKTLLLVAFTSLLTGGCVGLDARKEFAKCVDGYTRQILPEYKAYIEKDPSLEQDTKRIRTQTADEFDQYVQNGIK